MGISNGNEEESARRMMAMMKRRRRGRKTSMVSFSAKMPEDVCEAFQDKCICAVKYSRNPLCEMRESIVEVVQNLGIRDWNQMEELIYCYISLNSSEMHSFIEDAFLTLPFTFLHSPILP